MEPKPSAAAPLASTPAAKALRFGPFRFDPVHGILQRDGHDFILPPRAAAVLKRLLESPGEVVSKESLLDAAWGGLAVSEQSLSEAIKVIRRTLGDDPSEPVYIQTVHRRGYRFVAPLRMDGDFGVAALPALPVAKPSIAQTPAAWAASLIGLVLLAAGVLYLALREPALPSVKLIDRSEELSASSLSPDGTELAYVNWSAELMLRDLETARERRLDAGPLQLGPPPVWSRDGSRVAYTYVVSEPRQWEIRTIDVRREDPTLHYRSAEEPALVSDWAPDGEAILFATLGRNPGTSGRLFELSLAHGTTKELVASARWEWPPRALYSPDGTRIAYSTKEEDKTRIYLMPRDGQNRVRLSDALADESFPLWSPDARFLLFRSKRGSSWDFWAAEIEGLTRVGAPFLVRPDVGVESVPLGWTPSGWLLYMENTWRGEAYRLPMDPKTMEVLGKAVLLTERLEETVNEAVPSRAGDRVSVSVQTENGKRFFVISALDPRPLPTPTDFRLGTVIGWSPDDRWVLLWGRTEEGEDVFLRAYPSDGLWEKLPVEPGPPLMGHFAALSPDGRWMVLEEGPYDCTRQLVLVSLKDGSRRRLGVGGCRLMPAWSPDGRTVAVARNLEELKKSELLLIRPSGGRSEKLGSWDSSFGVIGPPTWSPDGRHIAFVLHRTDHNELFVISRDGGTPRLLYQPPTPIDPWRPYWLADGRGIVFTGGSFETRTWMMRDFAGSARR